MTRKGLFLRSIISRISVSLNWLELCFFSLSLSVSLLFTYLVSLITSKPGIVHTRSYRGYDTNARIHAIQYIKELHSLLFYLNTKFHFQIFKTKERSKNDVLD